MCCSPQTLQRSSTGLSPFCQHLSVDQDPKLLTVLQKLCPKCWIEGYNYFPQPPSYSLANAGFVAVRAHFWLVFSSLSTRTLKSFSIEMLSSQPAPSLCHCHRLLHPRCRTSSLCLLSVLRFPSAHFCSFPRSPWMAALPASTLYASHIPGMRWLRMHCVTLPGHWVGPPQIICVGQDIPNLWYVHY